MMMNEFIVSHYGVIVRIGPGGILLVNKKKKSRKYQIVEFLKCP